MATKRGGTNSFLRDTMPGAIRKSAAAPSSPASWRVSAARGCASKPAALASTRSRFPATTTCVSRFSMSTMPKNKASSWSCILSPSLSSPSVAGGKSSGLSVASSLTISGVRASNAAASVVSTTLKPSPIPPGSVNFLRSPAQSARADNAASGALFAANCSRTSPATLCVRV
eukprot:scaffold244684_cov29-Tisochrysis_lutea.AAC.2